MYALQLTRLCCCLPDPGDVQDKRGTGNLEGGQMYGVSLLHGFMSF